MLPPAQERLFVELAADHLPRTLRQLFCCVKHNDSERVMYRRLRLLARDAEYALRIDGNPWCIANWGSGFVMRARANTPPEMLATNVKPSQKAKSNVIKIRPSRSKKRVTWTARSPRIFLDPNKVPR